MERIKLTQAGDSLTIAVTKCAKAEVGQYPGVEFFGTTPDGRSVMVEVPQSSADRQLGRLELTYDAAVGKTLKISRDPNSGNPAKPWWGIYLAPNGQKPNGHPTPQKAAAMSAGAHIPDLDEPLPEPPEDVAIPEVARSGANPAQSKLVASFKLYDAAFDHALKVAERAQKLGWSVDVAAIAATLYIAASKNA